MALKDKQSRTIVLKITEKVFLSKDSLSFIHRFFDEQRREQEVPITQPYSFKVVDIKLSQP